MKEVPNTEVNVDTVYVRENIVRIEEEEFTGWQYDEIQYDKAEYENLVLEQNRADIDYLAIMIGVDL